MLGPFAVDTHFPAFGGIANEFGVQKVQIQATLSAYLISSAIMTLVIGPLSDAFGRKKIILSFLGIFFIASFAAIFANNLQSLIICRVLQGMAGGTGMVLGQAVVRDKLSGSEAQKTMSAISMIFGIAPAFAPILGGFLYIHFGWRSIFLFLCLFAAYNFIVIFLMLDESLKPSLRQKFSIERIFTNYFIIMKKPEFTLRAIAHGLGFAGIGVYICVAPSYIIDILKLNEASFGWLFIPIVSGMFMGSLACNKTAGKISQNKTILIGVSTAFIASLISLFYVFIFEPKVPFAILPMAIYAFGYTFAIPCISIKILDLMPNMRGTASAAQSFIVISIFSLFSVFIAPLIMDSAQKIALTSMASLIFAIIAWQIANLLRKNLITQ